MWDPHYSFFGFYHYKHSANNIQHFDPNFLGSNDVAVGYDEGSVLIKLGREEPAMSMDASGKIVWAKHSEMQQANLKTIADAEIKDGERLPLSVKDMGSCEVYPQTIAHNPNGR
jgi:coatomer subunit beta'